MAREHIEWSNGLQVWLEEQQNRYTASFGVWVASGSSMETPHSNGVSHFLEHMCFKGSGGRSAAELAARIDAIGGQLDAYTTKEYTCFYARTLTEHVAEGFGLLADMVARPHMTPETFETERGVVLEEIGMSSDDPEDAVGEQLERAVWRDSPYGMPILGTRETVEALTLNDLQCARAQAYAPNRMVISVSGRFDRDALLRRIDDCFGAMQPGEPRPKIPQISYHPAHLCQKRRMEQTHLCFCLPSISSRDPRRWALSMLNHAVGGCDSSRLFQRIREELGLAYAIESDPSKYESGGAFYVQAAVNPSQAERAAREIAAVLRRAQAGISEAEFVRAREGLKSALRMSMESSVERAAYAGRGALAGEVLSDDELLAQVEAVTRAQVNALAAELFDLRQLSTSVCGPAAHPEFFESLARA